MPCGWCQESYAKGSLGLFSCPLNPTSGKLLSFLLWLRSLASTNGIKMPFCPPLRAFLCLPSKAGTTTDTGATPAAVYEMEKIPSPSLCHCLLHCSHGGVSIPLHPKLYGDNGWKHPIKGLLASLLSPGFGHKSLGTEPSEESKGKHWVVFNIIPLSSSDAVSGISAWVLATFLWLTYFPGDSSGLFIPEHPLLYRSGLLQTCLNFRLKVAAAWTGTPLPFICITSQL